MLQVHTICNQVCLIGFNFYFPYYQMNKSTPLTQLPTMGGHNVFVNDQQRQMVMQAQNSVNAIPIPQNTQLPVDGGNEDDATIQEVLNQINGGGGSGGSQGQMSGEEAMMMAQMMEQQPAPQSKQPMMTPQIMAPQLNPSMFPTPMVQAPPQPQFDPYQHMQFAGQYPPQPQPIVDPLQNQTDGSVLGFITTIAEDVKFASFIFLLFIIVHFIPLDKFLMKYFALDKIPYYDVILKAVMAFVAVILFRKLLLKTN